MDAAVTTPKGILLLTAGVKGAIGSTLAVAVELLKKRPDAVLPYLMTADILPYVGSAAAFRLAGWDTEVISFKNALQTHGVIDGTTWAAVIQAIERIPVKAPPRRDTPLAKQVEAIKNDIQRFRAACPDFMPILINLLPAGKCHDLERFETIDAVYGASPPVDMPDLVYVLGAVEAGIPVVNFSPNQVDVPAVIKKAAAKGVPVAGRDGKTGQTYFKMVLASALRARKLMVNGWYSLNILGNADGRNLMSPEHAACKLDNKTGLLQDILGYQPGYKAYGTATHKVHIDFYPPRGDAKEAWDVIDFEGLFGMPMSLRLDLLGRDSILAAPMVLDLARWMVAAAIAGRTGAVSELAFYFKRSIMEPAAVSFQDQLQQLERLRRYCDSRLL